MKIKMSSCCQLVLEEKSQLFDQNVTKIGNWNLSQKNVDCFIFAKKRQIHLFRAED